MWFCKINKIENKIKKEQYEIKCIKDYIDYLKAHPEIENIEELMNNAEIHLFEVLRTRIGF